ncbi:MAG: diguanylate cyclase [Sulfurospirillaceae bacterium]|nr:diguanylate cyclase [Sulfurospirillaceae bacterium]
MQENKKILAIISGLMLTFLIVVVIIVSFNFKNYSQAKEYEQANVIASLVKDGLTAHMASGTMSKRELFLDNAKKSSGARDVWIFRTDKVVKLFGKGFRDETIRDDIDRKVIKTAKTYESIDESFVRPTLRVTIPYIASSYSNPNCLKCHTNAKEGEVLGGISMVFNIEDARFSSFVAIIKILGAALVFIVFFIYIANKLFKPYIGALIAIKESLKKANKGDYLTRIEIKGDTESTEVFRWLNTLLEKLEKTIGAIDKNISLFVADRRKEFNDPLEKSQAIIEDIAMIYRFKRTIEQDTSKEVIYKRLIKIFKEQLNFNDVSLFEIDIKNDKRILIYHDNPEKYCSIADYKVSQRCRAYRTNSIVVSDDFENICQSCSTSKEYLCINYPIDENVSLVVNIKPKDKAELFENKKAIGYIKNYLESARPVLQSKILTEILQRSNMIDGLTKLYNRKYLDIFMETEIREYKSYSVAMIDIDYFKKINDSFGHDAGDKVLKGLSEVFRKVIKEDDVAFRFGGEEFLIFIPNTESALETVQNIKDEFEKTIFKIGETSINKTLSAGISYFQDDALSAWQVIKNADIALYDAKNNGRNKIVLFKDIKNKDK